jgi:cytochrome P450
VRVPIHVISLALGLPTEDLPWFHTLAVRMTTGGVTKDESAAATREFEARIRPLVEQRRVDPGRETRPNHPSGASSPDKTGQLPRSGLTNANDTRVIP